MLKTKKINKIKNGIVAPQGFLATGGHIGLKKQAPDLTLLYTEKEAVLAGVFTQNTVRAACVERNQMILDSGAKIKGIAINSAIANTCTGIQGSKNNEAMANHYAKNLNTTPEKILTASTGVIGYNLPIEKITKGIEGLIPSLNRNPKNAKLAAKGILTTDTYTKEIAVEFELDNKPVKIGAMAKGSGMICPNMATMLAFVNTDANISCEMLQKALKDSVNKTYNMISVDGDTSTNDMVITLANGLAQNTCIESENKDYNLFKEVLDFVNTYLAKQIVSDGEGANKLLQVDVSGAKNEVDAKMIAKTIINSNLVKTALFGEDANWGRILAAAGRSGADFNPQKSTIKLSSNDDEVILFEKGNITTFCENKTRKILKGKEISLQFILSDGEAKATAWGCDLSYEYVRINGEYRT